MSKIVPLYKLEATVTEDLRTYASKMVQFMLSVLNSIIPAYFGMFMSKMVLTYNFESIF